MALCCLINGSSPNKCSVCGCHLCYRCSQMKLRKLNLKYQKALRLLKGYYKFVDGCRRFISIKVVGIKEARGIIGNPWRIPLYDNGRRIIKTTDRKKLIALSDQVWKGYRYHFKVERLCQTCARRNTK